MMSDSPVSRPRFPAAPTASTGGLRPLRAALAGLLLLCALGPARAADPAPASPTPAAPAATVQLGAPAARGGPEATVSLSLVKDARRALRQGSEYLLAQQLPDGSWKKDPAITGLVLYSFLLDPLYNPNLTAERGLQRAFAYLENYVQPDGGIYRKEYSHYTTAVCLLAFAESKQSRYADIVRNARAYLIRSQVDESEGYREDHPFYGGIGYGGDDRPDLSNTHLALEAIRAAEQFEERWAPILPANPGEVEIQEKELGLHWRKALVFLARCQNVQAVNSMPYATDDGGFIYETGTYKAERSHSYGSMTYAGVKSLVFAQLSRDDERVRRAVDWIAQHYTWDENPGFGTVSLYYYFMTGAKCLAVLGDEAIPDASGQPRFWREDLIRKLLQLQKPDGSWINENGQYWENLPDLTTAYTLVALKSALAGW